MRMLAKADERPVIAELVGAYACPPGMTALIIDDTPRRNHAAVKELSMICASITA